MNNEKGLHIIMTNGDRKAEFKAEEFNQKHQLAVIDGVFKFFEIDVNFKEMIETYEKSGQAFRDFYEPIENRELTETNEIELFSEEVEEEKDFEEEEQIESLIDKTEAPAAVNKDIKIKNGKTYYKCHYICPDAKCRKRANHYILEKDRVVECHECYRKMTVKHSTLAGFPEQDLYGNYFIAGNFKMDLRTNKTI